jgi:hypothetical protein
MLMRRIVKIFYETDVESAQQCPGMKASMKNCRKFFCAPLGNLFTRQNRYEKNFPYLRTDEKVFSFSGVCEE